MFLKTKEPQSSEPSAMTRTAKTTAMSRTMQLAIRDVSVPANVRGNDSGSTLQSTGTLFSAPPAAIPRTKVERYWAVRAFVAETLLSARDEHQVELAELRRTEEQKRERELGAILHANDQRQRRLERLMVLCLAVFLGFMGWLVMVMAPDRGAKGKSNTPSHFTIPILSPFASVVEHETGVLGIKTVAVLVLTGGIALYAALRHRLSQWPTR